MQKPKYVANCWAPVFSVLKVFKGLNTIEELTKVYEERKPTPKKIIRLLEANPTTDAERNCLDHLKRHIRTLEGNVSIFLRYVTGSDVITTSKIEITFTNLDGLSRRPVAHTCGCVLELPSTYQSYVELVEDFSSVLNAKYAWSFNFVKGPLVL